MQIDSSKILAHMYNTAGKRRRVATKGEREQMATWNETQQVYPLDACVPQLIAQQAAKAPDAVALIDGDRMLSYRELNRRANRLAHYLQARGVRPDVLVGLCVERGFEMVIGLLAILKAGGAYVPLDPTYPPERLSFMLSDARVPVLLTQQHLAARLSTHNAHVVCLDADAAELEQQPDTDPAVTASFSDLAYVIYTSGSTGQPKGVQITHASLLNLIFWHRQAFEVTCSDRATQLTSPAFDATGWEIWPYLTAGASIYLLDEQTRVSPELLRNWLLRCGITITFLPTALAESVLALEWPTTTTLRFLLTGADTLHRYPPDNLPFALINNYGPSEATVLVTSGRVLPAERAEDAPSIGRPIANTQIYILDEQLQQVPIGEPGELYIGGAGLARGYLNRPELTAERFIAHPFSDEPGERLYRTGDLARFLQDGQIAFQGRADYQIKIRGYRIEPGEIVSALNACPAIRMSYVMAREDQPGEKRLVAYLVLAPGKSVTRRDLQELLRMRLPDYMIPAVFVTLDELPVTANGKVDRAQLPLPSATNMLHDTVFAAPATPIEEQLASIIADLLGLERVGVDQNFFMLGGHSLLGTQIIARVANSFKVDLSLRTLFEASTIRQLSAEIEQLILARIEAMSDEEVLQLLEQGD